MLKLKCFSFFDFVVMIFIFSYIGIAILICSLVAMLTEDQFLTIILIFIFLVLMFTILQLIITMSQLNKQSSREHSSESEIFTIPIYQEPAPSYDSLFEMNTLPPPYEMATKKNLKESEVNLPIICVE